MKTTLAAGSLALAVLLVLLLQGALPAAGQASSWNFDGVKDKASAVKQAKEDPLLPNLGGVLGNLTVGADRDRSSCTSQPECAIHPYGLPVSPLPCRSQRPCISWESRYVWYKCLHILASSLVW